MTNDPPDPSPPQPPSDSPATESFSLFIQPGSGVPAAELPPAVPCQDPLTEAVARVLEQPPPQRNWMQSALLLGFTLVLFAAAGFFQTTPTDLALIVAALLLWKSRAPTPTAGNMAFGGTTTRMARSRCARNSNGACGSGCFRLSPGGVGLERYGAIRAV